MSGELPDRDAAAAARAPVADEAAMTATLCRQLGLGDVAPVLRKAAHHSIFALPPHPLVARIQSAEPVTAALARAEREVDVARHLGLQRPCARPTAAGDFGTTCTGPHRHHDVAAPERDAGDRCRANPYSAPPR